MVKVKGQISEMAVCLEDKEEKIASSAKMFFFELAQKVSHSAFFTFNFFKIKFAYDSENAGFLS